MFCAVEPAPQELGVTSKHDGLLGNLSQYCDPAKGSACCVLSYASIRGILTATVEVVRPCRVPSHLHMGDWKSSCPAM
jgi:hypothetical protein